MRGIHKHYSHIIEAFNSFRFGAFIEITNGIHPTSANYKASQAVDGERFFKKLYDKEIETKTGMIYIKNFKDADTSIVDFSLVIPKYDVDILKSVAHDLLNEKALSSNNKRFIEKLLQIDERSIIGYERLVNPDRETYEIIKNELGLYKDQYDNKISAIKGFSLEKYVSRLFKKENVDRVLTRVPYPRKMQSKNFSLKRKQDLDLLVICAAEDFDAALNNIKNEQNAELLKNRR